MANWFKNRFKMKNWDWKYLPHTGMYYILQLSLWVCFYVVFLLMDKPLLTNSFTISLLYSPNLPEFLFKAALIEEMLFRFLVAIPVSVGWPFWTPIATAVLLSTMYGYGSPDLPNQMVSFLSAMLFCLQFLDMGVWRKKYIRAFVSCVMVNMALNFSKAFFLILLMEMQ